MGEDDISKEPIKVSDEQTEQIVSDESNNTGTTDSSASDPDGEPGSAIESETQTIPATEPETQDVPATEPDTQAAQPDATEGAHSNAPRHMNKKKKIGLIVGGCLAALVIVLIVVGVVQSNKAAAIKTYKDNANKFSYAVITSGANMEKVGSTVSDYWHEYIFGSKDYKGHNMTSIDDAVDAAQSDQASLISTIASDDSNIQSLYNSLLKVPDSNDQELLAIRDAVKGLYSAYGDMYDCTIHVSGNYSTYNSKFNAADSNILSKWKTLNTTLGH